MLLIWPQLNFLIPVRRLSPDWQKSTALSILVILSAWWHSIHLLLCQKTHMLLSCHSIFFFSTSPSKWQKVASQRPKWTKGLLKKELFICRGVSWSWQGLVLSPDHLGLRPECVPAQRAHQISFGDPCCSAWDTTAWISFHFTALYEHFKHYLPFDLECLRQLLQKHWHLQGKGEFSICGSSISLQLYFFILSWHFYLTAVMFYTVFCTNQKTAAWWQ